MAARMRRIARLARRLSRSDPKEIPYRFLSLAATSVRRLGMLDASRVPEPSAAAGGNPWAAAPRTGAAPALIARADEIVAGKLSLLGVPIAFQAGHPRWNSDPRTGIELPRDFGPLLDFRDLGPDVDIKFLWEVNRHLWWVPVAQAYACSGDPRYLKSIGTWLESWLDDCPYPRGPNWSSPIEHGIRLINWSLVWHLIGGRHSPLFEGPAGKALERRWIASIYQHLHFIRTNYSRYTSAGNHRIGEAAGVYVGARTWPLWPGCAAWARQAKRILEAEAALQFAADGVNREQSFCYHRFSLEFLLAALLCGRSAGDAFSPAFAARIEAATGYLAACIDAGGNVPAYGDGDEGQVFSLAQGEGDNAYRAAAAIGARLVDRGDVAAVGEGDDPCAWLAPAPAERTAPNGTAKSYTPRRDYSTGGFVLLGRDLGARDEVRALFDVGPLGYNRIAGHGHADVLALTLSIAGREFLIDSGTYCYNAAPEWRRYFRGTAAHNTLEVDGQDQSVYGGSFLWLRDVDTRIERIELGDEIDRVAASHDGYRRLRDPVRHRRTVELDKRAGTLTVVDTIEAKKPHEAVVRWHLAPECTVVRRGDDFLIARDGLELRLAVEAANGHAELIAASEDRPDAWISRRFYQRQPSRLIELRTILAPGASIVTRIGLALPRNLAKASADSTARTESVEA